MGLQKIYKHSETEDFILTSLYRSIWHMDGNWYVILPRTDHYYLSIHPSVATELLARRR